MWCDRGNREAKDVGREGWALSYALDSDPRERAQGKTVEVGRCVSLIAA